MHSINIEALCHEIEDIAVANSDINIVKRCEEFFDATSLNITDTEQSIEQFTRKIAENYPNVATICVSPLHIENVGVALGDSSIGITATVGGFPLGQTYIEVKMLECSMAIENGADEVDFVIDVAAMNQGNIEKVKSEIENIVEEVDGVAVSKAILECGALKDNETLYKASQIALEAGVDFIKTSTGKNCVGASLEAAVVMALAIKEYYHKSGIKRGLKVAGGIRTAEDVNLYYTAVEHILGEEWLTPELFRIGASSFFMGVQ